MKRKTVLFSMVFFLISCTNEIIDPPSISHENEEPVQNFFNFNEEDAIPGKLIIKLKSEFANDMSITRSTDGNIVTNIPSIDAMVAGINAKDIRPVFDIGGKFERQQKEAGLHLWYEVTFDQDIAFSRAIPPFSETEEIEYIQPSYKIAPPEYTFIDEEPSPKAKSRVMLLYDDPLLLQQWHYYNDGSFEAGFRAGADINLFPAWQIESGKPEVIVAVFDEGVDGDHEDLAQNMWKDEQGHYGYNFFNDNYNVTKDRHGTHVAGIIGAVNNNSIGVSGIAGGNGSPDSGARIMSCQVFVNEESGGMAAIARAFKYAAENGAVIAQNSWGIPYTNELLKEAVDYFIDNAGMDENGVQTGPMKGGLVIAAAGNSGRNATDYPAGYDNVISVAALGPNYAKAYYSSWHSTIDISGIGGDVKDFTYKANIYSTYPENRYGRLQGTSMATPQVSGIAALIISKFGGEGFTPEEVKSRLLNTTKNIYNYNPAYMNNLGRGLVDAHAALTYSE